MRKILLTLMILILSFIFTSCIFMNTEEKSSEEPRKIRLKKIQERLQKPFQGPLESIAQSQDLTLQEVTECLPETEQKGISGDHFVEIIEEISTWGEILLIVHTLDGVFECHGHLEKGGIGAGYYNLGHGSPIAGHLRHEHCGRIIFVRRSFHHKETLSIQFFNHHGGSMFKIFLGRNKDGSLKSDQVAHFERLSGLIRAKTVA